MDLDVGIELGRLLARLDRPPDEVARLLKEAGISGVRNTVRFLNPLVRFVQARFHLDDYTLDVIKPGCLRLTLPDGTTRERAIPLTACEFLVAFNAGRYPELEDYNQH